MDSRTRRRVRQGAQPPPARRAVQEAVFVGASARASTRSAARRSCKFEQAQARRNAACKEIGAAKAKKDEAAAQKLMAEVDELKTTLPALEAEAKAADEELDERLATIPNLPLADVPDGADENGNVEHHKFGEKRELRVQAQAAFRARRSARPDGFRDRRETLRRALRRAEEAASRGWSARSASSCSTCIRASTAIRKSIRRSWCATTPCSARRNCRNFATINLLPIRSEFCEADLCEDLTQDREFNWRVLRHPAFEKRRATQIADVRLMPNADRLWLIPTAEVPLTNLVREVHPRRSRAAAALHRLHAVLPRRGGRGGQGHARHDPPAPVHQGRARLDHHAGAEPRTSTSACWPAPRRC